MPKSYINWFDEEKKVEKRARVAGSRVRATPQNPTIIAHTFGMIIYFNNIHANTLLYLICRFI